MASKAKKTKATVAKVVPEPVGRTYGPMRQALEAHDCPKCKALAGAACVGVPNANWPTGYPWPKSKVHAGREKLYTDSLV